MGGGGVLMDNSSNQKKTKNMVGVAIPGVDCNHGRTDLQ